MAEDDDTHPTPPPPAAPAPHLDPGPLALLGLALQPGADGGPQLGEQLLHHQVAQDLRRQEALGTLLSPHPPHPSLGGTGPHLGFVAAQHVPGAVLLLRLAVHADGIREGWSLHFGVLGDPWGGDRGDE